MFGRQKKEPIKTWQPIAEDWKQIEHGQTNISQDWEAVMRSCVVAQNKFLAEISKALDERSR